MKGKVRLGESGDCCSSSVVLYSTSFTVILIFYLGGSDTVLYFVAGRLVVSSSTLTLSGRCVPVEAADEEAMLITWPGLSTMI